MDLLLWVPIGNRSRIGPVQDHYLPLVVRDGVLDGMRPELRGAIA